MFAWAGSSFWMTLSPFHSSVSRISAPESASLRHLPANAASPAVTAISAAAYREATYIELIQAISPNQFASSVLCCKPSSVPSDPRSWSTRNSVACLMRGQLRSRNRLSVPVRCSR